MNTKSKGKVTEFFAKVGQSNRITIPQLTAEQLGLGSGDVVHIRLESTEA